MTDRVSRPVSPGTPIVDGVADLELIGRGGFARVYRGWQAEMRRHVAVKVLDGVVDDPDSNRRFRREVAAMGAASHHPNVVPVFVTGVTVDGHPYLIMPFYPGGNLNERLREGPLDPDEVTLMGTKVAAALAAAHDTGVLHRDVKPSNILFSAFGEPLLADFGIARLSDSTLTNANVVAATIAYAAPESLSGQPVGPVADVYSLGATLYAALAGVPPFVIGPDETLAAFVARAVTQPPADLRPTVPAPLAAAIERAMAKDPGLRTATAARLEEDLHACTGSSSTVPVLPAPADALAADPPAPAARSDGASEAATPAARSDGASEAATPGAAVPPTRPAVPTRGEIEPAGPGVRTNRRSRALAAFAVAMAAALVIAFIAYRAQAPSRPRAAPSSSSAPSTGPASTAPIPTVLPPGTTVPTTARAVGPVSPSLPPSTAAPVSPSLPPSTVGPVSPSLPPSTAGPVSPSSPPSTAKAATPNSQSSTRQAGAGPGAPTITDTVNEYYNLLSGGAVQEGFRWLTPAYQQQVGFGVYRSFWSGFKSIDASDVKPQGSDRATATLRYVRTDGTASVEHVELRFARDQNTGNLLIDGYHSGTV